MNRFNFCKIGKRASTWFSVIAASSGAILTWYVTQPPEIRETIPLGFVQIFSVMSLIGAGLVPLATSYNQKGLPPNAETKEK